MVVPGAHRFQRGACSKQSCGFSTQARSGTCCRRAIRTTKPCIGGFRLGVTARVCVKFSRMLPTNFVTKGCWMKKRASSTPLCDGQGWRRRDRSDQARKRHENHGDSGSPWLAAVGKYARRKSSPNALGPIVLLLLHD